MKSFKFFTLTSFSILSFQEIQASQTPISIPTIDTSTHIITCSKSNAKIDTAEAKACVDQIIENHKTELYNFVQNHNHGKHLGDMTNCTTSRLIPGNGPGSKGSYFPNNTLDFNNVFGTEKVACTANSGTNRVECTFQAQGNVCFLSLNQGTGGQYPLGELGQHTIKFSISDGDGQLRNVLPQK